MELSTPLLSDPRLVLDIALGVEHPDVLAARYELTNAQWTALQADPAFQSQVEAKKSELKREGYTFRMKCALAGEDLIPSIYKEAKSPDASFSTKLEAAKWFAKMGGLEPKEDKLSAFGAGLSIVIDMGDGNQIRMGVAVPPVQPALSPDTPPTVDVTPVRVTEPEAPATLFNLPFNPGELAGAVA